MGKRKDGQKGGYDTKNKGRTEGRKRREKIRKWKGRGKVRKRSQIGRTKGDRRENGRERGDNEGHKKSGKDRKIKWGEGNKKKTLKRATFNN